MEGRLVRPQETQGNDDVERPLLAHRITPRMRRHGRAGGPFGLRGKRHRHGHHTLDTADGSLMKGAAPVEIVADRPSKGAPRHPCLSRHPASQPWAWSDTGKARETPRGAVRWALSRRASIRCGWLAPASRLAWPVEHNACMPSAGPGAPPKRNVYEANLRQLQASLRRQRAPGPSREGMLRTTPPEACLIARLPRQHSPHGIQRIARETR